MPEKWSFTVADDGIVTLRARADGENGLVGDATVTIPAGGDIVWPKGLTYKELADAKHGTITITDGDGYTIEGK